MHLKFRFAIGAVVLLALAISADGAIVFNNFGPGDTFADFGLILQGESVGTIANVDQAAAFTVGSNSYSLTSVSLGISVDTPPNTGTGPLDIIIASDASGLPGSALKTYSLNVNTTGKQIVTGSGGSAFTLDANTKYWVIADARGTFNGAWNDNTIGDIGPSAGRSNNGPWSLQSTSSVNHFAFRVEGQVVPEPASGMVLLGLVVVVLAGAGRRLNRRAGQAARFD